MPGKGTLHQETQLHLLSGGPSKSSTYLDFPRYKNNDIIFQLKSHLTVILKVGTEKASK